MRRIAAALAIIVALISSAGAQNYTATQGTGTTFGSKLVTSVNYPQIVFCDPTTPANCVGVNASGQIALSNTGFNALQGGAANSAANPFFTSPGTGAVFQVQSNSANVATQTTAAAIQTALGSPFQAGGSIGNTSFGVSGTLPAYAATPTFNLGTLNGAATAALQTTGNTSLASITTSTANIPVQGQALAAASLPVVLTAAQITTLTPPAALTNFALETGGNLASLLTTTGSGVSPAANTLQARLATLNTTLGSPFQAGGSIGNTTFAATQGTAANLNATVVGTGTFATQLTGATNNINNIAGTVSLPTGAATSALQTTGNTTLSSINSALAGNLTVVQGTASNLNMTCANCSGSGASGTDEGGFTAGSSIFAPGGGFFQTTATSNALTTGQWGAWQMTANRAGFVNLRNAAGTEIGTSGAPVRTDPTGTTTQPVSLAANQSVNVAQINGVTPLMGNGATGTGSHRVTIASDNSAVAGLGAVATGAAPPANAIYGGALTSGATGGLVQGLIQCDSSAIYDASTSGSTEIVALTSGRTIYVCGYSINVGGTATNVKLVYGTGTNCATGATNMTPAYQFAANNGIVDRGSFSQGLKTASANALCLNASAANAVQAIVYYAKL